MAYYFNPKTHIGFFVDILEQFTQSGKKAYKVVFPDGLITAVWAKYVTIV